MSYCSWFQTFFLPKTVISWTWLVYVMKLDFTCRGMSTEHTRVWATANDHDIHCNYLLPQKMEGGMWCVPSCTLISFHTTVNTVIYRDMFRNLWVRWLRGILNSAAFNKVERRVTRLTRPLNKWEFPWWQDYIEKTLASLVSRLHSAGLPLLESVGGENMQF
jgi:hypothetical protein